jgi:hypothetical protein
MCQIVRIRYEQYGGHSDHSLMREVHKNGESCKEAHEVMRLNIT